MTLKQGKKLINDYIGQYRSMLYLAKSMDDKENIRICEASIKDLEAIKQALEKTD